MKERSKWSRWLCAASVRAIKTIAQNTRSRVEPTAVLNDVDWIMVGSTALLADCYPC